MSIKNIERIIHGMETSDGDGVKLTRIIGSPELNHLDPFLLLDEFKNDEPQDYIGGFPPHPHRGFETVTYMITGNFTHQDSRGNRGELTSGSIQWMTAGRGIIHSEMPAQVDGLVWGFQLWLNLPKKLKMIEPSYQDIPAEKIPVLDTNFGSVKIIAGSFQNKSGPGKSHTPFTYLDVQLKANHTFDIDVSENQNTFVYVIDGEITIGDKKSKTLKGYDLAILSKGTKVIVNANDSNSRFLFCSAEIINEPITRGGPFVMNTRQEIIQAFEDYQNGKIG